MIKLLLKILSVLCILGGIYVSWYFFHKLSFEYSYDLNQKNLLPESGQVGDFIGGVVGTFFSLAGFLILILTLNEQTKFATKERFESKFFDLLKLHRENIKEMENGSKSGRKELHDIFSQFLKCRQEILLFFNKKEEEDIYQQDYLVDLKKSLSLINSLIDVVALAKLNIPYLIIFYGVGAEGKETIKDQFENKYKPEFYEPILEFLAMKPISESRYQNTWKTLHRTANKKNRIKVFEIVRELRNNPNYKSPDYPNLIEKAKKK